MDQTNYVITPSLFFQYATCRHWIWHDFFTDKKLKGEIPELAQKLLEQGVLHEEEYVRDLDFVEVMPEQPEQAFYETLKLMKQGVDLIYQGEIQYEEEGVVFRGRPDLLEKRKGRSRLGDYFYVPVDIKSSVDIKKEQWMQLTLYAEILENVQGFFPKEAAIINRDHDRIELELTKKHRQKTSERIHEILSIMRGNKPPMKVTASCKNSPWYKFCVSEAEKLNDIALIYKLDSRAHAALRDNGIKTIKDAAKMDIGSLPRIPYAKPPTLERVKLQAQSLVDGDLKWIGRPEIPEADIKIYFDIEGDPLLQVEYMFGFWVVGDPIGEFAQIGEVRREKPNDKYFIYFLAEHPEYEEAMWKDFLKWVELLPRDGYKVYHFADYERSRTLGMAEHYGGSKAFDEFSEHYVDLSKVVMDSVIFPLYFYSIKDIAKSKFLNYKWRHEKAGGAQSIFWYEEWLETGNREILNDIINYNEDDVIATEYLHEWLRDNG